VNRTYPRACVRFGPPQIFLYSSMNAGVGTLPSEYKVQAHGCWLFNLFKHLSDETQPLINSDSVVVCLFEYLLHLFFSLWDFTPQY
jgi:hypothetical protein